MIDQVIGVPKITFETWFGWRNIGFQVDDLFSLLFSNLLKSGCLFFLFAAIDASFLHFLPTISPPESKFFIFSWFCPATSVILQNPISCSLSMIDMVRFMLIFSHHISPLVWRLFLIYYWRGSIRSIFFPFKSSIATILDIYWYKGILWLCFIKRKSNTKWHGRKLFANGRWLSVQRRISMVFINDDIQ